MYFSIMVFTHRIKMQQIKLAQSITSPRAVILQNLITVA
jgi:hypothetical protein